MIAQALSRLTAGQHLEQRDAAQLLDSLLDENATDAQIAAVLIALSIKGETDTELAGFAQTMRERCERVTTTHAEYVDTCGTGGSKAKTFNVSTAVAFVVAGAGLPVAKHGNVGVTSTSGSADVLRALGVNTQLEPDAVRQCLDEIGIGFMFAPLHHKATKRVAQVRKSLQVPTIFNMLGPLTNPAFTPFQVIGVSREGASERVARAARALGTARTWVVRGEDGLDEITLTGTTHVVEATPHGITHFEIHPTDCGFEKSSIDSLRGGDPEDNARTIRSALNGDDNGLARNLVLINSAAALVVARRAATLREGVELARESILSGAALKKLDQLVKMTRNFS